MKVAYLINQYPAKSHTFIRREILALEAVGVQVARFTIRATTTPLSDPLDQQELERTQALLAPGAVRLLLTALSVVCRGPLKSWRALRLAARLARRSQRGWIAHLAYWVEACSLLTATRKQGIRHLHAHFGTNPASVAMLWQALGGGSFSFTVHGSSELTRPDQNALDLKIEAAAAVFAISRHCRSQLYRFCPLEDWPKIHVVHCGLDEAFLAEGLAPITASRQIFWAGRFSALKGVPILIDAARILKERGCSFEFFLAGDGPLREELEQRVRGLGLQEQVRFAGWLPDEGIRSELERSRVMVLPSFSEGLPVVIMEAFARGRPVVASRITGIPELVEDGKNGWTVAPGDPEELADALQEALQASPERLAEMGRAGREAVLDRHAASRSAQQILGIFRDLGAVPAD